MFQFSISQQNVAYNEVLICVDAGGRKVHYRGVHRRSENGAIYRDGDVAYFQVEGEEGWTSFQVRRAPEAPAPGHFEAGVTSLPVSHAIAKWRGQE
jgi:hypothetical protein